MTARNLDRRAQRTRHALLAAFFGLVLERRYASIRIGDIIDRAKVGRSTFYEHFANKGAILSCSLEAPFSVLADTVKRADNTAQLVFVLRHFWDNRSVGKSLFAGTLRRRVTSVLVGMIEHRLDEDRLGFPHAIVIPGRLLAIQLAEVLLAPITAWLDGVSTCTPELLARVLRQSTVAVVNAMHNRVGQ